MLSSFFFLPAAEDGADAGKAIALAIIAVPAATLFYLFEVIIVVSIQAYIFAALSAIYIGSAIEPEH
jgi:F0F1-type ATP synthase membrane subunit a